MKRLTEMEYLTLYARITDDWPKDENSWQQCRESYRALCAADRERLFMDVLRNKTIDHQQGWHQRTEFINQNKNRGGSSYKGAQPVYKLAKRYLRMRRRHDPGYFAGKAAGEVREHCREHSDRYRHIPTQPTIKKHLKEPSN